MIEDLGDEDRRLLYWAEHDVVAQLDRDVGLLMAQRDAWRDKYRELCGKQAVEDNRYRRFMWSALWAGMIGWGIALVLAAKLLSEG